MLKEAAVRAALRAAAMSGGKGSGELAKKQCGRKGPVGMGHAVCSVAVGAR